MKGGIHYNNKQYVAAEKLFTTAINKNSEFFLLYLERGLTYEKLNENSKAKRDLKRSIELLPTAPAYQSLGSIAEKENDLKAAKDYYQKAAGSNSDAGKKSARAFTRLDLPDNPGKYFSYQATKDRSGNVIVSLKNRSLLTVKNLQLNITLYSSSGAQAFRKNYRITKQLGPGSQEYLNTGVAASTLGASGNIEVNFSSAEIVK